MTRRQPTIKKILANDVAALFSLCGTVAVWFLVLVWVAMSVFSPPEPGSPQEIRTENLLLGSLLVALILTAILASLFVWRVKSIRRVFCEGTRMEAMVKKVAFGRKGSGRIDYEYQWQGKRIASFAWIVRNPRTDSLLPGEPVEIIVDQKRPERSYVCDLYGSG